MRLVDLAALDMAVSKTGQTIFVVNMTQQIYLINIFRRGVMTTFALFLLLFVEVLLSVTSDLGAGPWTYMLFDLPPVSTKNFETFEESFVFVSSPSTLELGQVTVEMLWRIYSYSRMMSSNDCLVVDIERRRGLQSLVLESSWLGDSEERLWRSDILGDI